MRSVDVTKTELSHPGTLVVHLDLVFHLHCKIESWILLDNSGSTLCRSSPASDCLARRSRADSLNLPATTLLCLTVLQLPLDFESDLCVVPLLLEAACYTSKQDLRHFLLRSCAEFAAGKRCKASELGSERSPGADRLLRRRWGTWMQQTCM